MEQDDIFVSQDVVFGDEYQEDQNEYDEEEQGSFSDFGDPEERFEDEFKARERAGGPMYKEGEEGFVYLSGIKVDTPTIDIYKRLSRMDLSTEEKSKQVLQLQYKVFISILSEYEIFRPLYSLEFINSKILNIKRFKYLNMAILICSLFCLENKKIDQERFDIVYEEIGIPQKIAKSDLVKYCRYWYLHLLN